MKNYCAPSSNGQCSCRKFGADPNNCEHGARGASEVIEQLQEREIAALRAVLQAQQDALQKAIHVIEDILMADDGQAWKEARRVLPKLKSVLEVINPISNQKESP